MACANCVQEENVRVNLRQSQPIDDIADRLVGQHRCVACTHNCEDEAEICRPIAASRWIDVGIRCGRGNCVCTNV